MSNASFSETEVLVVGASLAGLCAAYSAARAGAEHSWSTRPLRSEHAPILRRSC